jgi:hypothetical protein
LKIDCDEAEMSAKDAKEELVEEQKGSDDDDTEVNVEVLEQLQKYANEKEEAATQALIRLKSWQAEQQETMQRMQDNTRKLQRRLKSVCATVRSEYSTSCLQEDFRAGLKELCRKPDEEEAEGIQDNVTTNTPLPEDFNMDVYCISANDYLKIEGIKPSSDGPPNTFSKARDTQIPNLRAFVHSVTASFRENFTKSFVNTTSDMVDRVKLLPADASNIPGGRTSRKCQSIFESEMISLEAKINLLPKISVAKVRRESIHLFRLPCEPVLRRHKAQQWRRSRHGAPTAAEPRINGAQTKMVCTTRHILLLLVEMGHMFQNQLAMSTSIKRCVTQWRRNSALTGSESSIRLSRYS